MSSSTLFETYRTPIPKHITGKIYQTDFWDSYDLRDFVAAVRFCTVSFPSSQHFVVRNRVDYATCPIFCSPHKRVREYFRRAIQTVTSSDRGTTSAMLRFNRNGTMPSANVAETPKVTARTSRDCGDVATRSPPKG